MKQHKNPSLCHENYSALTVEYHTNKPAEQWPKENVKAKIQNDSPTDKY